jgi:UDP-N-acetylmuramyl pentapeptide phosphotransferase/UDP-N-acetylglucosamine-1-phosphate transferase
MSAVFWGLLLPVLVAAVCSGLATRWIISLSRTVGFGRDETEGAQKFHTTPTPRIGGIALLIGLCCGVAVLQSQFAGAQYVGSLLLVAAIPVFLAGVIEDITRKVTPATRLFFSAVSAAMASAMLGSTLAVTGVPPIDALLVHPAAAFCLTLLVVAGFTHSVNIIDGFHGLASGSLVLMLLAMAGLSWRAGDTPLLVLSLVFAGAIAGFFLWNWPRGRIFLGDAGAYMLGFLVVEIGILLAVRNPDDISPMAPVLVGIYPLVETLYSMYRRKVVRGTHMGAPDAFHLHSLVYRRLVYSPAHRSSSQDLNRANAGVAKYLWVPCASAGLAANLFAASTLGLLLGMLLFAAVYVGFYVTVVNFRAQKWLGDRPSDSNMPPDSLWWQSSSSRE